ncbi:MAG: hypothetical protein IPG53_06215 [Ignavibacteriales bacterium]|nr:hypothetical protein [Ignavibacteriales bacterium]
MTNLDLKPIELRDYALAIGWTLIDAAIQDGLFVLNSPDKIINSWSFQLIMKILTLLTKYHWLSIN